METKTTRITLRSVDQRLKRLIEQGAKKQNKSINQFVVDTLSESLGYSKERPWEEFVGSVPKDAFDESIFEDFEKIDEKMWQ